MEKNFWTIDDCFRNAAEDKYFSAFIHKDYQIGFHSHEFYEINIVVSGVGRHSIEDMDISIKKGDVFVIPPYIQHSYSNDGGLDVCHILVQNSFFVKYTQELSKIPGFHKVFFIEPQLRQNTTAKYYLQLDYERMIDLQKEVNKLLCTSEQENPVCENIIALNIICTLCLETNNSTNISKNVEILEIMDYMQNHICEKITTESLADMFHLSKSSLNRLFKNALKSTPIQYLSRCRIEKAKSLVKNSSKSMSEIAQDCGFYDSSHMNKYLKLS